MVIERRKEYWKRIGVDGVEVSIKVQQHTE